MFFKKSNNKLWYGLYFAATFFVAGMTLQSRLDLSKNMLLLIGLGILILAYTSHRLIVRFTPMKRIERKIRKTPHKHEQLKIFFEEYLPETKKNYPQTIYKYVSLTDINTSEKEMYNSFSTQMETEKWIITSEKQPLNEKKLFSLITNSLWFTRSNSSNLNDPFEGRRIIYDDDLYPLSNSQIQYWKKYAENLRNTLFLCCFSKYNNSPPMWANYANNYKGYCLEFEIVTKDNLWEVDYSYGKNLPNFEFEGLKKDLWEDRITEEEAYKYIEQLHIYWATSKHGDWKYESEIRAMLTNLQCEMNIAYKDIGINLTGIIIGHNCAKEHREFLSYAANKLSIPLKITALNTTGINYLDIIDYKE